MVLLVFQVLVLTGMLAIALALLGRYATYSKEASSDAAELGAGGEESTKEDTEEGDEMPLEKLAPGQKIRVQLLGDRHLTAFHPDLAVTSEGEIGVESEGRQWTVPAGKPLRIVWEEEPESEPENAGQTAVAGQAEEETAPSLVDGSPAGLTIEKIEVLSESRKGRLALAEGQTAVLTPAPGGTLTLPELERGQERPSYKGRLLLEGTGEGLRVVNEVGLEEYLCSVVSSEMPSYYPLQALCAQAVCARTYAVNCIRRAREQGLPMDLDDSVSYQVYNNYPADEAAVRAVRMTRGLVMNREEVLYYSTSCQTRDRTDLDGEREFRDFLATPPEETAEYGSPWLRWSVSLPREQILEKLQELYGCSWERLARYEILERSPQGQVLQMVFSDGEDEVVVKGEYQIRKVLGVGQAEVLLRDGAIVREMQLLPSAYFYIEREPQDEKDTEGPEPESGPDAGEMEPESGPDAGETKPESGLDAGETEPESGEEPESEPQEPLLIYGGGYGHGIGMSQYGAAAMASKGAGYRQILEAYYGT